MYHGYIFSCHNIINETSFHIGTDIHSLFTLSSSIGCNVTFVEKNGCNIVCHIFSLEVCMLRRRTLCVLLALTFFKQDVPVHPPVPIRKVR